MTRRFYSGLLRLSIVFCQRVHVTASAIPPTQQSASSEAWLQSVASQSRWTTSSRNCDKLSQRSSADAKKRRREEEQRQREEQTTSEGIAATDDRTYLDVSLSV